MTRRVKPPRVTTAVRFPPDVLERLREEADVRGVSINWMVNAAITELLERLIPMDQLRLTRGPEPASPVPGPTCVYCDLPAGHDGDHDE